MKNKFVASDSMLSVDNVFTIPVGHYFSMKEETCYLVYSPLANVFFLALPPEIQRLEETLHNNEISPVLEKLKNQQLKDKTITSTPDYNHAGTLYIILNEKCNFHCRYCYSANGRSSQEISMGQILPMVDFFLAQRADAPRQRTIMFIGGGEPTLSWPLIVQTTEYAKRKAKEEDIALMMRVSTNGSILTEEMLSFYKQHSFNMQISYEVLPDVQRAQRGTWTVVDNNLKRLLDAGLDCTIRSTITRDCVERLPEMVEFCFQNYPRIVNLICEPVVDSDYFKDEQTVHEYFNLYEKAFDEAKHLARKYHMSLMSSSYGSIRQLRERFCYNLIVETPYGTLTTCPNISAPHEKGYNEAVFARVEPRGANLPGKVRFDNDAYKRLTHGSIHSIAKCQTCWARWNCGSGCPSQRQVYTEDIFDAICVHTRSMLLNSLIYELAERFESQTGKNMFTAIGERLKTMV